MTLLVLALVGLAGVLAWNAAVTGDGRGGSGDREAGTGPSRGKVRPPESVSGPGAGGSGSGSTGSGPGKPKVELEASSCPAELSNCVVASGRVIYVERVDPDGDGDAHFVTSSSQGVTLPGVTIFDVRAGLRPDPLPAVGDLVGGAGPVYPGSRGQKQIEVIEFNVAR